MADTKIGDLTQLSATPATGDQFFISDISEADDNDKGKYITWGTIDAAIDTIIAANADGFLVASNDLSDVASAATARTNLGLAIGTDVQAYDADLAAIAALTNTDGNFIVGNGSAWVAESGATARTSLGLTIGTDVQAYDAGLADIAGLAVTDGNIIVGDGANWVAENGATARTSLGLAIGTNVQAWNDNLDDLAALTPTKGNLLAGNGTDWIALGVGTDTQVLTADSAEASGIKWAASAGGGGSDTLADIATNSTTTAHQTFALDAATSLIVEDSGGTDILTVVESTGRVGVGQSPTTKTFEVSDEMQIADPITQSGTYAISSKKTVAGTFHAFLFENDSTSSVAAVQATFENDGNNRSNIGVGGTNYGVAWLSNRGFLNMSSGLDGWSIRTNDDVWFVDSTNNTFAEINTTGIGIGVSPSTSIHAVLSSVLTNGVGNIARLAHTSTGTPAAGFGVAARFDLESSTTTEQNAGRLIYKWTTATHATRAAEGALTAYYTSTERTPIRWGANSSAATLGFYNTTPIAQPSSTGETTGFTAGSGTGVNDDSTFTGNVGSTAYRISDIVQHLKNLGLLAQ